MAKTITHIDSCPEVEIVGGKKPEKFFVNSCRLCNDRGLYRVYDADKKEAFYLCEKHKACYDETAQDLTPGTKKALAIDNDSIAEDETKKAQADVFVSAAIKDIAEGKAAPIKAG